MLKDPISSLSELSKSDATLALPVDHDIQASILKTGGYNRSYHVAFDKSVPVGIMSHVRDMVLDWACALENEGILGEGISFTMEEKQKAQDAAKAITINNYGHFHQGDTHGHQNKTVIDSTDNSVNTITTENVFDQAIHAINSNIANQNDREELVGLVEAMKGAQGTDDYKPLFQKWVGYLAEYATVLGPFLPALSVSWGG